MYYIIFASLCKWPHRNNNNIYTARHCDDDIMLYERYLLEAQQADDNFTVFE